MYKAVLGAALLCAVPAVAQAQAFTGPYIGTEGGIDNYELKAKDVDLGAIAPGATATFDGLSANGATGGVYAGFQLGLGGGFVALEGFGRISGAGAELSATDGTDSFLVRVKARESYGAAIRAGAQLNDATGLYVRGGWVNTRFKATADLGTGAVSESDNEDAIEYGAGIETAITPKAVIRAEYVMADYGNLGLDGVSLDNGTFRASLAFRF